VCKQINWWVIKANNPAFCLIRNWMPFKKFDAMSIAIAFKCFSCNAKILHKNKTKFSADDQSCEFEKTLIPISLLDMS